MLWLGIGIFIFLCIKEVCVTQTPEGYNRNSRLQKQDLLKVTLGEMSKKEFNKNLKNGKYR